MRADLGDEPEHPLEVVISNPPGQDATRTPQLTGNVGQRSLHSARISEETRTADTATLCQTQKVSLTETRTRVLANGGQAPNQLHHRGSLLRKKKNPRTPHQPPGDGCTASFPPFWQAVMAVTACWSSAAAERSPLSTSRVRNSFHSLPWGGSRSPRTPPEGGILLPDGASLAQASLALGG